VEKCESERPLRLGWEEDMLNLQEVGCGVMD
jgi:hypothetical protein